MVDEFAPAGWQPGQRSPHFLLRRVLNVPHVGLHDRQRMLLDHLPQVVGPLLIGGDLGRDVGQIRLRRAAGIRAGRQQCSAARRIATRPASTSLKLRISTPSSARFFENGGIEPGVMPPISAWWARLAVKKRSEWSVVTGESAQSNTGVMTVTSGKCEPPR